MGRTDLLAEAVSDAPDMIATYPSLDSLTVDTQVVPADGLPVSIRAYASNPQSQSVSGVRITITAWEPISGSTLPVTTLTVSMPAASHTVTSYSWAVPASCRGKHFELLGELSLPLPNKMNYIVNGTFDGSGCNGWTIVNDYPPTLGGKCEYGYMETYSSIYNTTDRRAASAYQDVTGPNLGSLTIAFRALYQSKSGSYGYGVAYTAVQFLNASGTYLGGAYQMRTEMGIPSDTATECFGLVQGGVWIGYEESVKSILTKLPGIALSAVARIRIRTAAYPYCSLGYCNPSSLVRLDDVYVVDDAQTVSRSQTTVYASTLTASIIGDRRLLLEQCLGTKERCGLHLENLVPYASDLNVWTDMHDYLCASNVYRASGDNTAANFAIFFSITTLVGSVLEAALLPAATVKEVAVGAVMDLAVGGALSCVHEAMASGEISKSRDLRGTADGALRALRDSGAKYRYVSMTQGKVVGKVSVGGHDSTADTLRHGRILVDVMPDTLATTVVVGDSIHVLESGQWMNRNSLAMVEYRAIATGPVSLAVLYQNSAGGDQLLVYRPTRVTTGAILRFGFLDSATSFPVNLDWTGDGVADTTLFPSEITEVQAQTPQGARLGVVLAYPNPFNPRVTVDLEVIQAGPVDIAIHDARGRTLRTLFTGTLPSGMRQLVWDGLNARGTPMASGSYFVVVRSGDEVRSRRISLVR
jgi:hypothetical protein